MRVKNLTRKKKAKKKSFEWEEGKKKAGVTEIGDRFGHRRHEWKVIKSKKELGDGKGGSSGEVVPF